MPHVDTHGALRRVGRVVVHQGWRIGQESGALRAVAGAGGRSRCLDAAGARCRTASAHVVELRSGAGSIPASCRIFQTVEAATFTPSTSSSPCTRRYPHPGFSRNSRNTRTRIERSVRGRPGRRGRDRWACRRATISRCQRSSIRVHHQVQSLEHVPREPVHQRRQQRPITQVELHPVRTELPLQDQELVAQREDLCVFVPAAHRQQPQQREHVRHTEIGQSQQHGRSPCHSIPLSCEYPTGRHRAQHRPHPCIGSHQHG